MPHMYRHWYSSNNTTCIF